MIPTLLRLAVPNTIINVTLIAVSAGVDALIVGRLGAEPLAGRALVFPLDGDRDVAAGELLVVPRGAEHSARALSDEVHLLVLGPAPAASEARA